MFYLYFLEEKAQRRVSELSEPGGLFPIRKHAPHKGNVAVVERVTTFLGYSGTVLIDVCHSNYSLFFRFQVK